MRIENKQSGGDLDDHRGTKWEALISRLGYSRLGSRMMAEQSLSTNFLQVFVTVEVQKQPFSKGCCYFVSAPQEGALCSTFVASRLDLSETCQA